MLAERLLAPIRDAGVDALLLGCTHYPFLARTIGDVMGHGVTLVSSADETAFAVRDRLVELGLEQTYASRRAPSVRVEWRRRHVPRTRPRAARPGTRPHRTLGTPRPLEPPGAPVPGTRCTTSHTPDPTGDPHAPSRWPRRRRTATDLVPTRFHRDGRRLRARHVREHPRVVHGERRRGRAPLDAGERQGVGHRGILDAARRVAGTDRSRSGQGQAERPHRRDPAVDRPLAARGVRHEGARRAPGDRRLRRAAG